MANLHRGEIEAILDGRPMTLCLTLGALAELEAAFGDEDMLALANRFASGRLSARERSAFSVRACAAPVMISPTATSRGSRLMAAQAAMSRWWHAFSPRRSVPAMPHLRAMARLNQSLTRSRRAGCVIPALSLVGGDGGWPRSPPSTAGSILADDAA